MLGRTSLLVLLSLQAISGTLLEDLDDSLGENDVDPRSTITTTSATTAPPDNCAPDCTGATNGNEVENPKNCNQFYVCLNEEPIGPIDCPDGQHFGSSGCVTPAECTPSCGGGGGGASCHYECIEGAKFRADRYDCSTYYQCDGDNDVEMQCDQDYPFFDGEKCQTEEKNCCHCKPYCSEGTQGEKVFDPTDCTQYYYCLEDFTVPQYSGHCTNGNFDPIRNECSSTVPCLTFCTNVVQPDGCIDEFICEESGYHAKCVDKCVPEYYTCLASDIGSVVEPDTCSGIYVFDPVRNTCVAPSSCSIG